tara:strand:+ start:478 stop:1440 length:963 start_codon:yes stop_codon:yes gene_type:complete
MSYLTYVLFIFGLVLISYSANVLVKYTENISHDLNISYFFSSLIFIGLATSSPEIFIALLASLDNKSNIAIGNALGSNIANIALVFAVSFFFIKLNRDTLREIFTRDVKAFFIYIISISILLIPLLTDGQMNPIDSIILFCTFLIFLIFLRKFINFEDKENEMISDSNLLKNSSVIVLSILLLIFGTQIFLNSSIAIASFFGVPNYVIGLSLTAIGTSIPELAASIQSARRGNVDFIIGNILGSNIFNIVLVLGLVGLVDYNPKSFIGYNEFLRDISVIILTTILLIVIARNYNVYLSRMLGMVLFLGFMIYQYNLYIYQ